MVTRMRLNITLYVQSLVIQVSHSLYNAIVKKGHGVCGCVGVWVCGVQQALLGRATTVSACS